MKQMIFSVALIGLMIAANSANAQVHAKNNDQHSGYNNDSRDNKYDSRDNNFSQDRRIQMGIRNGSITRQEARRLQAMQMDIKRMKRMAMADGFISLRERQMLKNAEQRFSFAIYKARHDHNEYAYRDRDFDGRDRNVDYDQDFDYNR